MELYDLIDNELNDVLYQSLNDREKRLCKRNLIKLCETLQDTHTENINTIILNNTIQYQKHHNNTLCFLLIFYFTFFTLIFTSFIDMYCV